ncbi:cellulose binding domain-containing protein [Dactylosporangium vinaceum]|uniref:histidine kinase n=1 Tax=Dactylosporangium vinaceum TaxID=53362 RepID=A0ABV5M0Z2_9ACTN|nr:cellulose binding domain-containing protein [Dactylosporangium vinaceum]UAB97234.1 cellulose binding domain-containing protein [Dactylosporangium vinaceum]
MVATVLPSLPGAIVLIAAAAAAGALLGWPGAVVGLGLAVLVEGTAARVAVGLAGILPWAAMLAWRRYLAFTRARRAARVDLDATMEFPRAPLPILVAALTQEWSARTGIGVILHSAGLDDDPGDDPAGRELSWVLREALRNVAAHARASTVAVTLQRDASGLTLEVRDDGAGFVVPDVFDGFGGLLGMQERARAAGGRLEVWSRPGGGTRITVTVAAAGVVRIGGPTWRVRLGAGLAAAAVPLLLVALMPTPDGRNTPLAAGETGVPFDPNATRGPATPLPATSGAPARSAAPARTPPARTSSAPSTAASAPAPPPPATEGTGTALAEQRTCRVAYVKRSEWSPGFVADVTLTNLAATPVSGWTLRFDFTAGQKVTTSWNGVVTQNGPTVTVAPPGDRPSLAAGASLTIGVQGTWQGTNPSPASFTLNGAACS